jgi:hypothetical protein
VQFHDIVSNNVHSIGAKYGVNPETTRAMFQDFLATLHEVLYKGCPTQGLMGVYFGLGDEAAFHFGGIVAECYDPQNTDSDSSDDYSLWIETMARLDGRMSRFRGVLDRWAEEKAYEEEQQQLDREHTDRKAE